MWKIFRIYATKMQKIVGKKFRYGNLRMIFETIKD